MKKRKSENANYVALNITNFPKELSDLIEETSESKDLNKKQVVVAILSQFFGKECSIKI